MTLKQVDEVLRSWRRKLTLIAENLLNLQEDATFRSLTGTGGLQQAVVTGMTAARVKPLLGMLPAIFEQFELLQSTIDRAEKLRAELPALFGGEAKGRELQSLLFGPSIQLPARELPLERRTLLSGGVTATRSTPSELLAPMEQNFGLVRDAVSLVTHASLECLGRCDAVEQEIVRLRSERAMPSAAWAEALDAIGPRLEAVRGLLRTDPLGAQEELRIQIEPALASLSAERARSEELQERLHRARARCEEMLLLHDQALGVQRQHPWMDTHAGRLTLVSGETVQALGSWLDRLEQRGREGILDPVIVGLRNWNVAVDRCLSQDRDALAASLALADQRSELCGRLGALEAKARARGLIGNLEAKELRGKAVAHLYGAAPDLQGALFTVAAYQRFLSETVLLPNR